MRLVAIVLVGWLLTGCASVLTRHAEAASVTASAIDAAGAMIEREAATDYAAVKTDDERRALRTIFAPIETAYGRLCVAQAAYVASIRAANAAGQTRLSAVPVEALSAAWGELTQLGDAVGVHVPALPAVVSDLLRGTK